MKHFLQLLSGFFFHFTWCFWFYHFPESSQSFWSVNIRVSWAYLPMSSFLCLQSLLSRYDQTHNFMLMTSMFIFLVPTVFPTYISMYISIPIPVYLYPSIYIYLYLLVYLWYLYICLCIIIYIYIYLHSRFPIISQIGTLQFKTTQFFPLPTIYLLIHLTFPTLVNGTVIHPVAQVPNFEVISFITPHIQSAKKSNWPYLQNILRIWPLFAIFTLTYLLPKKERQPKAFPNNGCSLQFEQNLSC